MLGSVAKAHKYTDVGPDTDKTSACNHRVDSVIESS